MTKASSPVDPLAGVTGDPLLATSEASASDLCSATEPVMAEQPESELTPAATDPQSSEIRPIAFLSSRITTATYQDAVMYRNKVMVSNHVVN